MSEDKLQNTTRMIDVDTIKALYDMVSNITASVSGVLDSISKINFGEVYNKVRIALESLSKFVESYSGESFSEEEKTLMIETYKTWGAYGWTVPPWDVKDLLKNVPENWIDANRQFCKFANNENVNELFEELRNDKRSRKLLLEEAIFDYDNKRYNSCASILIELIDAILIRTQEKVKDALRPYGRIAAENYWNKIKEKTDVEKALYLILLCENLISCTEKVFERAKDFAEQPEVINRNFLMHGMMHKTVTKTQCIQLFLLYYNWLQLLSFERD